MLKLFARAEAIPHSSVASAGRLAALTAAAMLATSSIAEAAAAPESFSPLAKQVQGAVVNISTTQKARGARSMDGLPFEVPEGSPFEEFFRQFRDQMPRGRRGMPQMPHNALGSGFIIDPSGFVVTNNHVIDEASDIKVTLASGTEYTAKLVGSDPKTDLALLKIESPTALQAVQWGDSDKLEVGDWVMAVGNPFGLGGTVTAGIVSARGRNINAGPFDDFLQTDASINQGNSGGPMFNTQGEVIGVNTAIYSPSGGSVGIGFAVPSNLARPIIEELKTKGRIERGWLGVQIQPVTPELASSLGLENPRGALVAEVQPDSPAQKAKIQSGDVILSFNGQEVSEMRFLPRIVAGVPAGKRVEVKIWRDGREVTIPVEVAKLRDEERVAANVGEQPEVTGDESEALGATLASITPELRAEYDVEEGVEGVLVVDIDPDGPAAEQGLRVGDVIETVAKKKVTTPKEVEEMAKETKREAVLLRVNRQGSSLYVAVKLDQA